MGVGKRLSKDRDVCIYRLCATLDAVALAVAIPLIVSNLNDSQRPIHWIFKSKCGFLCYTMACRPCSWNGRVFARCGPVNAMFTALLADHVTVHGQIGTAFRTL
jgi:hypothetical protein